jgi:hypothetical protein
MYFHSGKIGSKFVSYNVLIEANMSVYYNGYADSSKPSYGDAKKIPAQEPNIIVIKGPPFHPIIINGFIVASIPAHYEG